MKLDGVDGECVVEGYEGWMDLLSMSFGGSQSVTFSTGRGGGSGKVAMEDLQFVRLTDKCSPVVMRMLCLGQHFDEVLIHATKATGDKPLPYFTVKLNHALISSMDIGGQGENDQLTETGTLAYRQITVEYRIQNEDGTELGTTSAEYNVATGAT
ncbi:Hcp family type VI secretion system effector [Vannielia litorea]|uniref:Hcp family type VI secretion system effector n=1 Tax=Vannielia litorea TaxID=1217970 RepID=UPI001BCA8D3A|nr:type VI secretion system tube protein Hcp [Vannielia litorea]MBS8227540.1 Hcp1 family type VI secretion system effector [Vannielia litorea]